MGNDLYWHKTPEPERPKEHGISHVQYILMELFAIKERDDFIGMVLTKEHLPVINAVIIGLKEGAAEDVLEAMVRLADGIRKFQSITLTVHG